MAPARWSLCLPATPPVCCAPASTPAFITSRWAKHQTKLRAPAPAPAWRWASWHTSEEGGGEDSFDLWPVSMRARQQLHWIYILHVPQTGMQWPILEHMGGEVGRWCTVHPAGGSSPRMVCRPHCCWAFFWFEGKKTKKTEFTATGCWRRRRMRDTCTL